MKLLYYEYFKTGTYLRYVRLREFLTKPLLLRRIVTAKRVVSVWRLDSQMFGVNNTEEICDILKIKYSLSSAIFIKFWIVSESAEDCYNKLMEIFKQNNCTYL